MKIEIDQNDFQQLSAATQRELLQSLAGKDLIAARGPRTNKRITLRQPIDISPAQATRLVHGLSDDHRKRLGLFAKKNGRVRMKDILALTGETDLRATSSFQREMNRRLRRLIHDPEKLANLIDWDISATKWDANKTTITDGVYYVSDRTAEALKSCFKGEKATKKKRA